jgi:hypothetical protein
MRELPYEKRVVPRGGMIADRVTFELLSIELALTFKRPDAHAFAKRRAVPVLSPGLYQA